MDFVFKMTELVLNTMDFILKHDDSNTNGQGARSGTATGQFSMEES